MNFPKLGKAREGRKKIYRNVNTFVPVCIYIWEKCVVFVLFFGSVVWRRRVNSGKFSQSEKEEGLAGFGGCCGGEKDGKGRWCQFVSSSIGGCGTA